MVRGFALVLGLALAACGGGDGEKGSERTKASEPSGEAGSSPGGAGSGDDPTAPVCEAGRQSECPCASGGPGVQACADDGSKWEPCQCEGVKPDPPADPPSLGCSTRWKFTAEEAGCPPTLPVVYSCPEEYEESGVCRPNKDGNFSCCPDES